MYEGRTLIENYWIDRSTNRELFNETRRNLSCCRHFFTEQLGWRIVQNEWIIKLEKLPAAAESFMGITEFTEITDYCFLCALLVYLDDKEEQEQFLLSELVDALGAQLNTVMVIDWTQFSLRKSLIRVLKFAETRRFLQAYEGNSENLSDGIDREVLYENTGLSRYFATNFGYDTKKFLSYSDFEAYVPDEVDADRGHFRINRVYRQLVAAPAMYWNNSDDPDVLYVKNQRQWIGKTLAEQLGGQLHVHRGSAYFVLDEEHSFGEYHPGTAMLPNIVLFLCGMIFDAVAAGTLACGENTTISMTRFEFAALVGQCREKYQAGWSKEYRTISEDKLVQTVGDYMEGWMLLRREKEGQLGLCPGIGKVRGEYDADFQPENAAAAREETAAAGKPSVSRKKTSQKRSGSTHKKDNTPQQQGSLF